MKRYAVDTAARDHARHDGELVGALDPRGGLDAARQCKQRAEAQRACDRRVSALEVDRRSERQRPVPAVVCGHEQQERALARKRVPGFGRERVVESEVDVVHQLREQRFARLRDTVGVGGVRRGVGGVGEGAALRVRHLDGVAGGGRAAEREQREHQEWQQDDDAAGQDRDGRLGCSRRQTPRRACGGEAGAPVPAPAPLAACEHAAGQQQHAERDQQPSAQGRGERLQSRAAAGDVDPQRPDQLARARTFGIDEVVVVALEDVASAFTPDDAVQDHRMQHLVVVGDDFPGVVAGLAAHDRQVAGVEPRFHADPVGDDIARGAAERDRREVEPQAPHDDQSQGGGEEFLERMASHGFELRAPHP